MEEGGDKKKKKGGNKPGAGGGKKGKEEKIPAKTQIKIDNVMRIMKGESAKDKVNAARSARECSACACSARSARSARTPNEQAPRRASPRCISGAPAAQPACCHTTSLLAKRD